MMYQFSVSIIIPNYNNQDSLKSMLDSLNKIKYPINLLEIIIIDDCSTDQSKNILEKFKAPAHFTILFNKSNKGRAFTRNVGINSAKNEIVIFLDGDLVPDSNFVLEHVRYHQNKNIVMVKGNIKSDVNSKIQYYKYKSGLSGPYHFSDNDVLPPKYIVTGNLSIKKNMLILFNENLKGYGGEDTIFAYEINKKSLGLSIYGKKAIVLDSHNYCLEVLLEKYQEFGKKNLHIINKQYPFIFNDFIHSSINKNFFVIFFSNFLLINIMKIIFHVSSKRASSYILRILIYCHILRGYKEGR